MLLGKNLKGTDIYNSSEKKYNSSDNWYAIRKKQVENCMKYLRKV